MRETVGAPEEEHADRETLPAPPSEKPDPRIAQFAPGQLVAGKYLIEKVIGGGGLGVVAAAKHLQLEQRVAIKYLQAKVLDNKKVVERFLREARLASKIQSEHVVRVF